MLLSVIVPVYNEEKTIRELVSRVRSVQISKEIMLVNDGSHDLTPSILDAIQKEHVSDKHCSSISVVHKENGGKGSALKRG
jgi:glycosyltransferase involved in cell wall biosynthesis